MDICVTSAPPLVAAASRLVSCYLHGGREAAEVVASERAGAVA
jgi:hypothetical protein